MQPKQELHKAGLDGDSTQSGKQTLKIPIAQTVLCMFHVYCHLVVQKMNSIKLQCVPSSLSGWMPDGAQIPTEVVCLVSLWNGSNTPYGEEPRLDSAIFTDRNVPEPEPGTQNQESSDMHTITCS